MNITLPLAKYQNYLKDEAVELEFDDKTTNPLRLMQGRPKSCPPGDTDFLHRPKEHWLKTRSADLRGHGVLWEAFQGLCALSAKAIEGMRPPSLMPRMMQDEAS